MRVRLSTSKRLPGGALPPCLPPPPPPGPLAAAAAACQEDAEKAPPIGRTSSSASTVPLPEREKSWEQSWEQSRGGACCQGLKNCKTEQRLSLTEILILPQSKIK